MDRGEKVAYYCSELSSHSKENNNNNNNHSALVQKHSSNQDETVHDNSMHNSQQPDGQSANGTGDYPSNRILNRFNQNPQLDHAANDQQLARNQFVQNQLIATSQQQHPLQQQQQQSQQQIQQPSMSASSSSISQPQYLISNSNPQHLTNLTPQQFNSQPSNGNSPFQNQLNYHINSNQLYQPQQPQARTSLFQHQKTPSMGDDGHPKLQNQVIFSDTNKQQHLICDQDLQRNHLIAQDQRLSQDDQSNLNTSQSMNQGDFDRIRRKPEHFNPGLTSEVELGRLDIGFENMLISNNIANNFNNQSMQKQNNSNKITRSLVNQQGGIQDINCDKPTSSDNSVGYGRAANDGVRPSKDSQFMVYNNNNNRSEDNIYEEIDPMIMSRLQSEYPIDSLSLRSDTWKKKNAKKFLGANFTRWFSTRKKSSNSQNSDQDENIYIDSKTSKRPRLITLPEPIPPNLTPEKLKRRLIVSYIVDSENSYTNSLYRLIHEYKKPLEESDPPILSANKIGVIFFCLEQILQFHTLFGFSLNPYVQEWDEKERIGEVFTTSFSNHKQRTIVLEIYSGFINNFTNAMETARRASKSKAFAQFLHDKSVSSADRLSFFGSMVKPVQRFPQFILLLSDLLKHTPFDHPDRMALQRALTELESLADRLNEMKRDAERHFAVKQLLKDHLNESQAHSQRFLLRQDDTCLLDMDPSTNTILKSKTRKIYLLNDMLICVSSPSNRLKFAIPLSDITVVENITPAISNLLAHSNFKGLNEHPESILSPQTCTVEGMERDRQYLLHDSELMMQIAALVSSLRFCYNGLHPAIPEQICIGIREEIRKIEFQMTLIDRSCLQLRLHSKNHKDTLVVQFGTPEAKRDWLIDVRLTKLALDRANNPGWENVTDNPAPTHQASLCSIGQRLPLFVKSLAIFKSDQSSLTCALHYYLRQAPFIGENPAGVLWICNVNVGASSLGALSTNGAEVSLIHSYELSDSHVTCLESVLSQSTIWIGLQQGRIIVIDANSPGKWNQFASLDVQAEVTCIKHFDPFVYVGLKSGDVVVFDMTLPQNADKELCPIHLSQSPVTCLMPINDEMFACSDNRIWRIKGTKIVGDLTVEDSQNSDKMINLSVTRPNLLAHCGNGIWVSLVKSPIIKLYHAETLAHLVDIDVGKSIRRVLNDFKGEIEVTVTSMMATRGLLWVGTNVGMIATLTLPRLQGVPLVSGDINIALHRFLGPVNILLNLSAGSECIPQLPYNNRHPQPSKPNQIVKNEDAEAIYGQYADLMNVGDYITTGKKSGPLSEGQPDRVGWDFPAVNISSMNVSDDSGSTASSGAIYGQDGIPRGMRQMQNKAIMTNTAHRQLSVNQQQQQSIQNQLLASHLNQQLQTGQVLNDQNHIYDKSHGQPVMYNQGSINSMQQTMPQNLLDSMSMDRLHQRNILSTSQSQLATSNVARGDQLNSQSDHGSQSGKTHSTKLYDQPAQLIQQQSQQIIQQPGMIVQADGNGNMTNMQPSASTYGSVGGKLKNFGGNKTVLVLAGGNGYQRMATGDNKPFGEHAHCIIWEYKT